MRWGWINSVMQSLMQNNNLKTITYVEGVQMSQSGYGLLQQHNRLQSMTVKISHLHILDKPKKSYPSNIKKKETLMSKINIRMNDCETS